MKCRFAHQVFQHVMSECASKPCISPAVCDHLLRVPGAVSAVSAQMLGVLHTESYLHAASSCMHRLLIFALLHTMQVKRKKVASWLHTLLCKHSYQEGVRFTSSVPPYETVMAFPEAEQLSKLVMQVDEVRPPHGLPVISLTM